MRIQFVAQPFEDGFDLRDFLTEVLQDTSLTHLDIVVAWAKRSGLGIIEEPIRDFRGRGGYLRMIVGIDEGGATKQGLRLSLDLADEVYVYHVVARTFHPKIYAAYGQKVARVLVGSHNLTAGGAASNYEAGALCELRLDAAEDRQYLSSVVDDYFNRLLTDAEVCIKLDERTLDTISTDSMYQVDDEDNPRPRPTTSRSDLAPSPLDMQDDKRAPIFGRSKYPLRSAPTSINSKRRAPERAPAPSVARPPAPTPAARTDRPSPAPIAPRPAPVITKRWFKELRQADAQQPNTGTSPTGHLTLTRGGFPIDHTTYFRRDFFGDQSWGKTSASREQTSLAIRVVINGKSLGTLDLVVDHYPYYEAGQGNRTTTLRWGPDLNDYLRNHDLVGDYVTIEKFSDGSYRLTIDKAPTGSFMG